MSHTSHQTVRLSPGKHLSPAHGACVMELASMLAGEPFSDHPRSVCPVIASYLRALNDLVDDESRERLYPYASAAVGTAGDEALAGRRLGRCRAALEEIRQAGSPVRRLLATAVPTCRCDSAIALEQFTMHVVRLMRRRRGDWVSAALAIADDMIAIADADGSPPSRVVQSGAGTAPATLAR